MVYTNHRGRMAEESILHFTIVKETPAKELHASTIYDHFRNPYYFRSGRVSTEDQRRCILVTNGFTGSK